MPLRSGLRKSCEVSRSRRSPSRRRHLSGRRIRERQITRKSRATSAERTEQAGPERDCGNRRGSDDHSERCRNARIDGKIPRGSLDTVRCSDMLQNARNRWNLKGFCLSNAESNLPISMLEPTLDSKRETTMGLNACRWAFWTRPEMKPRTLRSGFWMRDRDTRATAHGLPLRSHLAVTGSLGFLDSSAGRALLPIVRGNAAWQQPGIRLVRVPCIARGDGGSGKGMSFAARALGSVPRIPGKPLYGEEAR